MRVLYGLVATVCTLAEEGSISAAFEKVLLLHPTVFRKCIPYQRGTSENYGRVRFNSGEITTTICFYSQPTLVSGQIIIIIIIQLT